MKLSESKIAKGFKPRFKYNSITGSPMILKLGIKRRRLKVFINNGPGLILVACTLEWGKCYKVINLDKLAAGAKLTE